MLAGTKHRRDEVTPTRDFITIVTPPVDMKVDAVSHCVFHFLKLADREFPPLKYIQSECEIRPINVAAMFRKIAAVFNLIIDIYTPGPHNYLDRSRHKQNVFLSDKPEFSYQPLRGNTHTRRIAIANFDSTYELIVSKTFTTMTMWVETKHGMSLRTCSYVETRRPSVVIPPPSPPTPSPKETACQILQTVTKNPIIELNETSSRYIELIDTTNLELESAKAAMKTTPELRDVLTSKIQYLQLVLVHAHRDLSRNEMLRRVYIR